MSRLPGITPAVFLLGCLSPESREDHRRLEAALAPPPQPAAPQEVERTNLSASLDLKTLVAEALRRNPSLRAELERTRASAEQVEVAGSLGDPVFKVEAEGVPIDRPVDFERGEDTKVGLSQAFPFPGKLGLRKEAALREARAANELYRAEKSGVIARLKKAYFEYYLLVNELAIHGQHVSLLEEFERVSEAKFRAGTVPQQDVLKAQLELVMLHNDVIGLERRLALAKGEINVLLDRPSDAPLGEPRETVVPEASGDLRALLDRAMASRPELLALEEKVKASRAGADLARRDFALPDFMVGADYWIVGHGDDLWGGFVSVNLPWLTGKNAAEARRMDRLARAGELELEAGRRRAYFAVRDAYTRVEAARSSVTLIRGELLPKATQSVEVTRVSYQNDKASFLDLLDAERALRDVEISRYRASAELESAVADLEQATGANLEGQQ